MRLMTRVLVAAGCCIFLLVAEADAAKKKRKGDAQAAGQDAKKGEHKAKPEAKKSERKAKNGEPQAKKAKHQSAPKEKPKARATAELETKKANRQNALKKKPAAAAAVADRRSTSAAEASTPSTQSAAPAGAKAEKRQSRRAAEKSPEELRTDMPVNLVPASSRHPGHQPSIDKREQHQEKRIDEGIHKGALTPEEQANVNRQHDEITRAEQSFRGDGKLSQDERQKLQGMLNDASRMIWAGKHDTDGRQLNAGAFGKDVFARDDLLKKVSDPNLSATDARAIAKDYRTLFDYRRKLNHDDLPPSDRAKVLADYNNLLNRYFEVRPPK